VALFARVALYEVPEEKQAKARAGFDAALERIREAPGLHEGYVLLGTESSRAVTITFWESHDAMAASRVLASHVRSDAAAAVGGEVVSVEEFEVVEGVD
jgi:heme-degrading monooxygenase HmoA